MCHVLHALRLDEGKYVPMKGQYTLPGRQTSVTAPPSTGQSGEGDRSRLCRSECVKDCVIAHFYTSFWVEKMIKRAKALSADSFSREGEAVNSFTRLP